MAEKRNNYKIKITENYKNNIRNEELSTENERQN